MKSNVNFTPQTIAVLRDADRKIRGMANEGTSHYALYQFWRTTMGKLCNVDLFYVGHFREDNSIVFPYVYDGDETSSPDRNTYGPNGMCSWILRNAKPYLYSQDAGKLLHKGHAFGDITRLSQDAVVIPLFEGGDSRLRIIGQASMQSYEQNSYGSEMIAAFQWLAAAVLIALKREHDDEANRANLGFPEGSTPSVTVSLTDIVEEISLGLHMLRRRVDAIRSSRRCDSDECQDALEELRREIEVLQTSTIEILSRPSTDALGLLALLTPKEKEIANYIAIGYDNAQIAETLHISEPTVKTHVSRILRKFNVRQRSAVAAKLRPLQYR